MFVALVSGWRAGPLNLPVRFLRTLKHEDPLNSTANHPRTKLEGANNLETHTPGETKLMHK